MATHTQSWTVLDADNKEEVIKSLTLAMINGRMIDVTFTRGRAMRGAMGEMFIETFKAGSHAHGIYRYEDVVSVSMSPGRIV